MSEKLDRLFALLERLNAPRVQRPKKKPPVYRKDIPAIIMLHFFVFLAGPYSEFVRYYQSGQFTWSTMGGVSTVALLPICIYFAIVAGRILKMILIKLDGKDDEKRRVPG